MKEADIKNYILARLQTLIPASLGTVVNNDFKTDFLSQQANVNKFPLAVISPADITSEVTDSNDNRRTYTFEIFVAQKGENLQSSNDMENLRETIMDLFDSDLTFGGNADGGILPASTSIGSFKYLDMSWAGFVLILKPRALIPLS